MVGLQVFCGVNCAVKSILSSLSALATLILCLFSISSALGGPGGGGCLGIFLRGAFRAFTENPSSFTRSALRPSSVSHDACRGEASCSNTPLLKVPLGFGRLDWLPRPDQAAWTRAEVERKHNDEGPVKGTRRNRVLPNSVFKLILS